MLKKIALASLLLVATNAQAWEETAKSVAAGVVGGYSVRKAHEKYAKMSGKEIVEGKVSKLEATKKQDKDEDAKEVKAANKKHNEAIDAQIKSLNESKLAQEKETDMSLARAQVYAPAAAISTVATTSRVATAVMLVKKAVEVAKAEDKKETAKAAFSPKANKGFAATAAVAVASGIADVVYGRSFIEAQ